jgi:serine/threonine protein kinase
MGTELAIKVVEKQKLWQSQVNVEKMENELITIEQIRHPNIVSILELLQDDHNYYIVTEYLTEGNLLQYL